jgi:hypothetical protein
VLELGYVRFNAPFHNISAKTWLNFINYRNRGTRIKLPRCYWQTICHVLLKFHVVYPDGLVIMFIAVTLMSCLITVSHGLPRWIGSHVHWSSVTHMPWLNFINYRNRGTRIKLPRCYWQTIIWGCIKHRWLITFKRHTMRGER